MQYLDPLFTADPKQPLHFPHIDVPWYQEKALPEAAPPVTARSSAEEGTGRATSEKSSSEAAKLSPKPAARPGSKPLPAAVISSQALKPGRILSCHQAVGSTFTLRDVRMMELGYRMFSQSDGCGWEVSPHGRTEPLAVKGS